MANILRKIDCVEARLDSGKVDFEAGRRAFFGTVAAATFGATAIASTGGALAQAGPTAADVYNFALNLEYLEAEFYLRAAFNRGLADADISGGNPGAGVVNVPGGVTGGSLVNFSGPGDAIIGNYARELAQDEEAHVRLLRNILGGARVARPAIDLTNSFAALGTFSGLTPPGSPPFNAFASVTNFILASFVFEDVGVTAYYGGLPLILTNEFVGQVAGIALTEAYHAGAIRAVMNGRGLFTQGRAISNLRDFFDGPSDIDQDVGEPGASNILPANIAAIPFSRTPTEVLAVVYAGPPTQGGGFFPNRMNGRIR